MKALTGKLVLSYPDIIFIPLAILYLSIQPVTAQNGYEWQIDEYGAITGGNKNQKNIYLIFTGHEFYDGAEIIINVLKKHQIKASFFFTGDFYRDPACKDIIRQLIRDGHYMGAHSDKHLLYCSWEKRDSLLITRKTFRKDLLNNYKEMDRFGIKKEDASYYMPPFEWYNETITRWTKELGFTLTNFSPGTSSNQDWTFPETGKKYISSEEIFSRILSYEKKHTLNGFMLLTHIGTDPKRTDKFYMKLDTLIINMLEKGYSFSRLP
ncbi:MAG: polysaccharide deacetylase family protein [Cyclobacteriaceae bacterium]|nr:polysaccharide deacetylase family protein [Cyclobacteriaceae bacterium]